MKKPYLEKLIENGFRIAPIFSIIFYSNARKLSGLD